MNSFTCITIEDTIRLGKKIGKDLLSGSILALHGQLGAGKTAFTKGIALGLGVEEIVNSPTFTLISEYQGTSVALYHMDLYRIDSYDDFIMIGGDELLYGDGICVIEWAEKIGDDLPDHTMHIFIEINGDLKRTIRIEKKV
ncbi:MAG: tRNA (adenosine(37)-N6)-threonylcarbamoyltransferase complex ATPase subunit type 1 TsaE [Spirochaetales bacterium]|nr:tRNA (adenosine(37)-N6)-threonylcarbamoyltransferase complex ATPase subunit type 1 TsaE [Spirochaetales bacterium]